MTIPKAIGQSQYHRKMTSDDASSHGTVSAQPHF